MNCLAKELVVGRTPFQCAYVRKSNDLLYFSMTRHNTSPLKQRLCLNVIMIFGPWKPDQKLRDF